MTRDNKEDMEKVIKISEDNINITNEDSKEKKKIFQVEKGDRIKEICECQSQKEKVSN